MGLNQLVGVCICEMCATQTNKKSFCLFDAAVGFPKTLKKKKNAQYNFTLPHTQLHSTVQRTRSEPTPATVHLIWHWHEAETIFREETTEKTYLTQTGP